MKKNAKDTIAALTRLAQLDMDAVLTYEQAIKNLDDGEVEIAAALGSFQSDHFTHIDDLSAAIEKLGGEIPEFARDVKGFILEGMTAILSKVGTRSALTAMTQNELLTNATYKVAAQGNFSADIKALIQKNYNDEQRHIASITAALKEKFGWEKPSIMRPTAGPVADAMSL